MDLVALGFKAVQTRERSPVDMEASAGARARLRLLEHRRSGKKPQPLHLAAAFDADGVFQSLAEHLISAAYAHDRRSAGCQRLHACGQPALAQPGQIAQGALGSGEDHQIGPAEPAGGFDVAHAYRRMARDLVEIGEVGKPRKADDGDIERSVPPCRAQTRRQAVLVIDVHAEIGHHANHGHAAQILQHPQSGTQNGSVSAELVDDQPSHAAAVIGLEQLHGAVKLGEHPSQIDIADKQDRSIRDARHAHVHQVVPPEVDLRRTARPLDDDEVVFRRQGVKGPLHIGDEAFAVAGVVDRLHGAAHLSVHDHLAALIPLRLEEDGVHARIGRDAACLRLHHLGASHLKAVFGDEAVQGHVLALERRNAQAPAREVAADSRHRQAFSRIGHGALHHKRLGFPHAHRASPLPSSVSASRTASTRQRFSSGNLTANLTQPSGSPS